MAINIDTVYQRVLALANKEQRGYVTPQEFNLYANQAQLEILNQYFYDINQFGRMPGNDTEYSDMLDVLEEKLSPLQKEGVLGIGAVLGLAILPSDLYKLGTVYTDYGVEIEQVNKNEFLTLNSSKLTTPTRDYPVYTTIHHNSTGTDRLQIYPREIAVTGGILAKFIKKPRKVSWGYVVINDKALYNASASAHFELHQSEETSLVYRILTLAGISFEDSGLNVRAASVQEETRRIQQEKQ